MKDRYDDVRSCLAAKVEEGENSKDSITHGRTVLGRQIPSWLHEF